MKKSLLLLSLLSAFVASAGAQVSIPTFSTPSASRPAGLYVQVIDGLIQLSNPAGAQNFAAGQFGYTPSFSQPPVVVPTNPGMQFTPPPVFKSASGGPMSAGPAKTNAVDCEVR